MSRDFEVDDILAEFYASEKADAEKQSILEDNSPAPYVEPIVEEVIEEAPVEEIQPVTASKAKFSFKPSSPTYVEYADTFEPAEEEDDEETEEEEEPQRLGGVARFFIGLLFAILALAVVVWGGMNISLDHGVLSSNDALSSKTIANLSPKLDAFVNNSTADALSDLTFIRKVYSIPADAAVAPAPDPEGFGSVPVEEADKIFDIIEQARRSGLLDGQDVIFSTDVEFSPYADIEYYYDDTILVIAWKEIIDNRLCSCVEIKIADGSQLRRKIVNDNFGDPTVLYASQLASSVNPVIAMNADFYMHRSNGVCVYNSEVKRYETRLDVLYINNEGDLIPQKRGTYEGWDATQQFVYDNNIQFSLAFGPLIVENGEAIHVVDGYNGLGELNLEYSRAAIAQYDKLHYLFITVNHADPGCPTYPRATIVKFADIVASKGVQLAYNLDGGQTSEIYFQDKMYNRVDWGDERTVSDIIYFASAIPEDQR